MTEPSRNDWAQAFANQARSDWEIYVVLEAHPTSLPRCHALHHLQMACEKIAKAYRLRDTQCSPSEVMRFHTGVDKFINLWFASPTAAVLYAGRSSQHRYARTECQRIAREIEGLAPAAYRQGTPANVEYPWADNGAAVAPCAYSFPETRLLVTPAGRHFLKVMKLAIDRF